MKKGKLSKGCFNKITSFLNNFFNNNRISYYVERNYSSMHNEFYFSINLYYWDKTGYAILNSFNKVLYSDEEFTEQVKSDIINFVENCKK